MRLRVVIPVFLAAFAASTLVAGPAGAGGPCPPPAAPDADGMVKRAGSNPDFKYRGRNVYNLDADDQEHTTSMNPGDTKKVFVKYRNADNVTHDIRVDAVLLKDFADFAVTIIRTSDGKDVTDRVLGDTGFRQRNVPSKGSVELKVFWTQNMTAGSDFEIDFQGNYGALPVCGDTVIVKSFS